MTFQLKALAILASSIFLGGIAAEAQTPNRPVKIGILSDMSSLYADQAGLGSIEAARMAI
jgi:branched-chain amino acid transport system substrate-binding protein